MERRDWERRDDETPQAYNAFCAYYLLPAAERSIDAAWRREGTNRGQNRDGKRAPTGWGKWSAQFEWVKRAAAYDDHLARLEEVQHEAMWLQRKRELRERDWAQGDALRAIVDAALPHANQFIRQRTQRVPGQPTVVDADGNVVEAGTPAREITVMAFDVAALARVVKDASTLQRLATDEPTDNLGLLSGAALQSTIDRALEALADKRAAATASGDPPPASRAGGNQAG